METLGQFFASLLANDITAMVEPPPNAFGLDALEITVKFLGVIEGRENSRYNRFKSWIVQQIKRGLTVQEEIDLAQGIVNYIQSEPATADRKNAMDYLFALKFLNTANNKKY